MKLNNEVWADCPGYEGLYWVSNNGRIKTQNWKNTGRESILRPITCRKGYLNVGLQKDGKLKSHKLHRLIALAFVPKIEGKDQVNHIDGDKQNNHISNLEWVTPKENTRHAIDHGLFHFQTPEKSINKVIKRGELNGLSILTDQKVREIRRKFKPRVYTRKKLALEYGVTENCIKDVVMGKSWKHVL